MESRSPETTPLLESGRSLLTNLTDTVSARVKFILPNLIRSSVLFTLGSLCVLFGFAWFSVLAWQVLRERTASDAEASALLGGAFLLVGIIAFLFGRQSGAAALESPVSADDEAGVAEMRSELTAFTADVSRAAKKALDPAQILEAHAGKIIITSAVLGVLLGMRGGERPRRKKENGKGNAR